MKVTKKEIEKKMCELMGQEWSGELHLGVETDEDMVVVARPLGLPERLVLSVVVRGLGKKHGETYTLYFLGEGYFERYKADSGFKEVEEKKPFPVDVVLTKRGAALWSVSEGKYIGDVSDEALTVFCQEILAKLFKRRGEK